MLFEHIKSECCSTPFCISWVWGLAVLSCKNDFSLHAYLAATCGSQRLQQRYKWWCSKFLLGIARGRAQTTISNLEYRQGQHRLGQRKGGGLCWQRWRRRGCKAAKATSSRQHWIPQCYNISTPKCLGPTKDYRWKWGCWGKLGNVYQLQRTEGFYARHWVSGGGFSWAYFFYKCL